MHFKCYFLRSAIHIFQHVCDTAPTHRIHIHYLSTHQNKANRKHVHRYARDTLIALSPHLIVVVVVVVVVVPVLAMCDAVIVLSLLSAAARLTRGVNQAITTVRCNV